MPKRLYSILKIEGLLKMFYLADRIFCQRLGVWFSRGKRNFEGYESLTCRSGTGHSTLLRKERKKREIKKLYMKFREVRHRFIFSYTERCYLGVTEKQEGLLTLAEEENGFVKEKFYFSGTWAN